MKILKFQEYINESYLESNFAPLYHYTNKNFLYYIILDDILQMSKDNHKDVLSVSTTRTGTIRLYDIPTATDCRIVLNQEMLRDDSYDLISFDIRGYNYIKNNKNNTKPYDDYRFNPILPSEKFRDHISSDKRNYVGKVRNNNHNHVFATEYEELILSDISPLGKYILSIDLNIDGNIDDRLLDNIKSYIKKYPHIKLNGFEYNNRLVKLIPLPIEWKDKILV